MSMEWKSIKLNDVIEYRNGLWSGKTGTLTRAKVIRVTEMRDNGSYTLASARELQVEARKLDTRRVVPNSILLERSGGGENKPVGRVVIFGEDVSKDTYSFSNFTTLLIPKTELVVPKYLFYSLYFFHLSGKTKLLQKAVTGIRNLDFNRYLAQEILLPFKEGKPDIAEQQRIADNFDNVFGDIENASLLLQKEQTFAASLWQSLANTIFTNQKLDKQQIDECCDVLTGGTPSRSVSEYWNGDIRWMASGDINKQFVREVAGRITKLGMESSNAKILPIKSVMVALNGQGKTRGMVAITEVELTCNQSLAAIVPKKGSNIDPDYLFWNLYSRYKEIRYLRGGEFRSGLNLSLIRQLDFPVPMKDGKPDLAEQKRIAKELSSAFAMSQRLVTLFERQGLHFTHLRAATLNKIFGTQAEEVKESVGNPTQTTTTPRLFDVQQAIAHIVKRFQRGEMVVAKLLYIGQAIYGVPTNLHFTAQNFGPYDSTVKKAVVAGLSSKNDFFAKRGTGQTQVLTLGVNANRILRYSTSAVAQKTNEYLDEMMPYFYQYDSASIELLATLCKIIEDEQTADDATAKAKLQKWKPGKFTDQDVSRTLAFIKKHEWDKRLIKK